MKARILTAMVAVVAVLPATATATAGSHLAKAASRQSRTSDTAIAGASVFLWSSHGREARGSGCTLTYSVRSKRTGKRGALTAGHCVAMLDGGPTYLVHQTQSLPDDGTEPGDLLGKVSGRNYVVGADGDSAFVALAPGRSARALVFVGGKSSRSAIPVVGVKAPAQDMPVCYSGAATGEHCGFTIIGDGPHSVTFKSGRSHVQIGNEWEAKTDSGVGCTSRRGDSGSPVYTIDNGEAYAVGILSGGQVKAGQCPFYFTPVTVALKALHLTLITGKPGSVPAPTS
ncbi:MAG TPA: hypothetical protein VHC43_15815 [Mycobacteriales bacterium]|nr:hypothetical protein [Mycobacteriales bacterium]